MAIVAAAGALSWHIVVRETFTTSELSSMEKVLSSLYPLGDLVLLFSLAVGLPRLKQGTGNVVLVVLAAGVAAFVIADSLFAYLTMKDAYAAGSLVDAGWVLGMALFGYAALLHNRLQPEYLEANSPVSAPGVRQLAPIVLLPFILAWLLLSDMRGSIGTAEGLPTCIFVIAYAVLVVARQAMNFLDSLEMGRRLALLNTRLEAKAEYLSDRLMQEQKLANHDTLTGVLNRRAVMAEIEQLLALPSLTDDAGAIGVVDVDSLKLVNDTEGHSAGDVLLRRIAGALCLEGAIVGRFGGDEFIVALPGANEVQVQAYIALVDWRLNGAPLPEGPASRGGFSAGFAFYPAESKISSQLLHLADQRMYAEKQQKAQDRSGGSRAA
ncbi:MAG: diguanylate cyclase [Dehalococcoidia bacterium]|nr:diguanylate cyclase [Dehalococcoidia bacterium]